MTIGIAIETPCRHRSMPARMASNKPTANHKPCISNARSVLPIAKTSADTTAKAVHSHAVVRPIVIWAYTNNNGGGGCALGHTLCTEPINGGPPPAKRRSTSDAACVPPRQQEAIGAQHARGDEPAIDTQEMTIAHSAQCSHPGNIAASAPPIISMAIAARMIPIRRFEIVSAVGDRRDPSHGASIIEAAKKAK